MVNAPSLQHVSSGGLALGMHALLGVVLVLSLSWRNTPVLPVEAELWASLPEMVPMEPRPPEPEPEPVPEAPAPATATAEPAPAEIALKAREEAKKQADAQREAERLKAEALKAEALKEARLKEEQLKAERAEQQRLAEEEARLKAEREEQARVEGIKRDLERQRVEREMARQARLELDREARRLRVAENLQVTRVVDDFRQRIQSRIQSYVKLPQGLTGNPEAEFEVRLYPNGEVRSVTRRKSSGVEAYDLEIERAILRASPLPLPADRRAAAAFRDGLMLKFRPQN